VRLTWTRPDVRRLWPPPGDELEDGRGRDPRRQADRYPPRHHAGDVAVGDHIAGVWHRDQPHHVRLPERARAAQAGCTSHRHADADAAAPGENPGTFAIESAPDELAYALKLDPVELRV